MSKTRKIAGWGLVAWSVVLFFIMAQWATYQIPIPGILPLFALSSGGIGAYLLLHKNKSGKEVKSK